MSGQSGRAYRVLKIKIDDTTTAEIKENSSFEIDLPDGSHNIKMYIEGLNKDQVLGYIDTTINVQGDTYYVYQPPKYITPSGGTGKLVLKDRSEYERISINKD